MSARGKDTWTGSDAWVAERMAQAAQYAGIASGFAERAAELRLQLKEADVESYRERLASTAADMDGERARYRRLVCAVLDDVLPFLVSDAARERATS